MTESLRSSLGNAVAELERSLGTLIGILWVCAVAGVLFARAADVSPQDVPVPFDLVWIALFLVAVVGAGWLADGGYERLGADPAGGWRFVRLAALFVPLAFVPLRAAIGFVASNDRLLDALFLAATTIAAGWLAFYGGLERLGLEPDDFLRVLAYAIALGAGPVAAAHLFDVGWLTDDRVAATVAVAVQLAAWRLGVTRNAP